MPTLQKRTLSFMIVLLIVTLVAGTVSIAPAAAKPRAPKNIIIMISDGWGYNQIAATSYYLTGHARSQQYTHFPIQLPMSTYEVEKPEDKCSPLGYDPSRAWTDFDYIKVPCATDSASAATAMSTGVKTFNGYIGVDVDGQPLQHLMQVAEAKGKATGVVTSVEFSHATPAGFVAHNKSRNEYAAIANEMIYDSGTDVIMGAGNPMFDNNGAPITPIDYKYVGGPDTWNDLLAGTAGNDADGNGDFDAWKLIQTREEFQKLARQKYNTPKRVIGVPQVYTTLQQARAGDGVADPYVVPFTETVPTLEEMTRAALNVLDSDRDGFVLMVEGGAVDWAGHAQQSGRVIEEQADFDRSVNAVIDWVRKHSNWHETLLIVTGDHETGYLTGPMDPANPKWVPVVNNSRGVLPGMQWNYPAGKSEHTNQLIPFYAMGVDGVWFLKYADQKDPVRGRFIDNTEIAKVVFKLLQGK